MQDDVRGSDVGAFLRAFHYPFHSTILQLQAKTFSSSHFVFAVEFFARTSKAPMDPWFYVNFLRLGEGLFSFPLPIYIFDGVVPFEMVTK